MENNCSGGCKYNLSSIFQKASFSRKFNSRFTNAIGIDGKGAAKYYWFWKQQSEAEDRNCRINFLAILDATVKDATVIFKESKFSWTAQLRF